MRYHQSQPKQVSNLPCVSFPINVPLTCRVVVAVDEGGAAVVVVDEGAEPLILADVVLRLLHL